MKCSKCGSDFPNDVNFCPYCGERIWKDNTGCRAADSETDKLTGGLVKLLGTALGVSVLLNIKLLLGKQTEYSDETMKDLEGILKSLRSLGGEKDSASSKAVEKDVADAVERAVSEAEKACEEVGNTVDEVVKSLAAGLDEPLAGMKKTIEETANEFERGFNEAVSEAEKALNELDAEIEKASKEYDETAEADEEPDEAAEEPDEGGITIVFEDEDDEESEDEDLDEDDSEEDEDDLDEEEDDEESDEEDLDEDDSEEDEDDLDEEDEESDEEESDEDDSDDEIDEEEDSEEEKEPEKKSNPFAFLFGNLFRDSSKTPAAEAPDAEKPAAAESSEIKIDFGEDEEEADILKNEADTAEPEAPAESEAPSEPEVPAEPEENAESGIIAIEFDEGDDEETDNMSEEPAFDEPSFDASEDDEPEMEAEEPAAEDGGIEILFEDEDEGPVEPINEAPAFDEVEFETEQFPKAEYEETPEESFKPEESGTIAIDFGEDADEETDNMAEEPAFEEPAFDEPELPEEPESNLYDEPAGQEEDGSDSEAYDAGPDEEASYDEPDEEEASYGEPDEEDVSDSVEAYPEEAAYEPAEEAEYGEELPEENAEPVESEEFEEPAENGEYEEPAESEEPGTIAIEFDEPVSDEPVRTDENHNGISDALEKEILGEVPANNVDELLSNWIFTSDATGREMAEEELFRGEGAKPAKSADKFESFVEAPLDYVPVNPEEAGLEPEQIESPSEEPAYDSFEEEAGDASGEPEGEEEVSDYSAAPEEEGISLEDILSEGAPHKENDNEDYLINSLFDDKADEYPQRPSRLSFAEAPHKDDYDYVKMDSEEPISLDIPMDDAESEEDLNINIHSDDYDVDEDAEEDFFGHDVQNEAADENYDIDEHLMNLRKDVSDDADAIRKDIAYSLSDLIGSGYEDEPDEEDTPIDF